jgi:hypothetical protein
MLSDKIIDVKYTLYTSTYSIKKQLPKILERCKLLAFDTETRSVYNKEKREEAKEYLKATETSDFYYKQARVVAESSGLSYPSIVNTTHFIFGESRDTSHVVVCTTPEQELFVWNLVADYDGKLLVHNSLFDLKIMFQRTGKLPKDFVDTALMVKGMINHVNIWKCKTGLKVLMGEYYPAKWSLMDDYEPLDWKNENFILYCAIDGCATYFLHTLILEEIESDN